jgi:hypothetical protein
MIATQQIKSTTAKPVPLDGYETINVLKWNNSKWKNLCPYLLKTDGNEDCVNPGGVLFENFYQGCKVYPTVYAQEVYPSKYQHGIAKYLWWKFTPATSTGDVLLTGDILNDELYFRWRDSLWSCKNPIRYPNGYGNKRNAQFSLHIDRDGNRTRMDYVTARKQIYVKEFIRLIRALPEYANLLNKLRNGQNIMLCEVDVPAPGKKAPFDISNGAYASDAICYMDMPKLEAMLNDTQESFGHGLCIAYALLQDLAV